MNNSVLFSSTIQAIQSSLGIMFSSTTFKYVIKLCLCLHVCLVMWFEIIHLKSLEKKLLLQ